MRKICIMLSIIILLIGVICINRQASNMTNEKNILCNDQSNTLLETRLEGIWYDNNYYLISFDLLTNKHRVDQYNSYLEFIKCDIGDSWTDIVESLPGNFSYWNSNESKLITCNGEELLADIKCSKLLKMPENGPYVFSTRDKNKLVVCSDPYDSTTFFSYDISGIVDLKQVWNDTICVKTLDDGHSNDILFLNISSSEVIEVVQGNYTAMNIGSCVVLKPTLFSGASSNEVYIYDFAEKTLTQLPLSLSNLCNIRFSCNGKYLVGYQKNRIEIYEMESYSQKGSIKPLIDYDIYENESILTVSNDGSKILMFDHITNKIVVQEV